MQVYLVGGAVRDQLLGRAVAERDWVVVGATPAELEAAGYRAVGRDFPVFLHPQSKEEYALARLERKVAPGYRGFVTEFSPAVTLEQDLQRRDLTINAMARAADGTLIDPYGGQADLRARVLRHVSAAFAEDPVRILRVARFLARFAPLGFTVAPETMALMRAMVRSGEAAALTSERVWRELERALGEACPDRALEALEDCGALAVLLPEFGARHSRAPALAALSAAVAAGAPTPVRWAALLADLPVAQLEALCARLRVPNEHRELALLAARLGGVARSSSATSQLAALNPQWQLSLFDQADAWRRPERFDQWLQVQEARALAAGVPAAAAAEYCAHLRAALRTANSVRLRDTEVRGHSGTQLAAILRAKRLAALEDLLLRGAP